MKLEVVVDKTGLPLGMATDAASVSEQDLLLPALDDVPLAVPDGKLDVLKIRPLARLGYFDYTTVDSVFTMLPTGAHLKAREAGLEGRPAEALA